MKQIKPPKGEVLQFDDQKATVMNTSAQRQHALALYKLNLEKQLVKREIRLDQQMVKKKLRELKRTRKNIKPCEDLLTQCEFQRIAKAVSLLPNPVQKKEDESHVLPEDEKDTEVDKSNMKHDEAVTKGKLVLPKIVTEYHKPPDQFMYPMTMRRPSIASTISPLLPVLPTTKVPVKKHPYHFKDLDDEDFFKHIKRRPQLPEIKQRQKEEQEKCNQMKDKINRFFEPEVEEKPVEEPVPTPVVNKRDAMRGRGFGNRQLTEISEKSDEEEVEEETKQGHKIVETVCEPSFDFKAEILSNPVFAARKKSVQEEEECMQSISQMRRQKLHSLAQTIIPHALRKTKVIGQAQDVSNARKRVVKFN